MGLQRIKSSVFFLCLVVLFETGVFAAVTEVGSGLGYSIGLSGSKQFVVVSVGASEYDAWLRGPSLSDRQTMTNRIYAHLPDAFDMIAYVPDEPFGIPDVSPLYGGRHFRISNYTTGIGLGVFDSTADFGSDGVLQSMMYLTSYASHKGSLLHEIMHRWGNGLTDVPSSQFGGNFGYSSVGGVLGGWVPGTLTFTEPNQYDADGPGGSDGFGPRGNTGNSAVFSTLELYLAGLAEPSEVADIEVAVNPIAIDTNAGTFLADEIVTVSIDDIIASEGERSQTESRLDMLSVVITDEPLSQFSATNEMTHDNELTLFSMDGSDQLDELGRSANYWEATGGRGSINFMIPNSIGDFDSDNDVDGSDFLQWQQDSSLDSTDFSNWQSNFGESIGSPPSSIEAIPEPASLVIFLSAVVVGICYRNKIVMRQW